MIARSGQILGRVFLFQFIQVFVSEARKIKAHHIAMQECSTRQISNATTSTW
jgi:hypothetical protein